MSRAGIALRSAMVGNRDFEIILDDEKMPVNIGFDESKKQNINNLRNLTLLSNKGKTIPLYQLANIEETSLSNHLERTNRGRSVTIKSQVIGRPAGSVSAEFKNKVDQLNIPESINLIYGGATKRTQDGLSSMIGAFLISILLVYLILAILYNSFYYPLVVLFSIPFAIIGAFIALGVTGEALSVFSIMGLIILVGLVGKNAILVVDFTNTLRYQGKSKLHALLEATRLRFRPILMTNLTMIIGLLPIAFSSGAGSEWKNGLAWVLIGGLSSAMILSLILVPLVYLQLEKIFRN
jgi:multidrug efflux pump subunit AcrB